jgi:hypothetical protein
LHGVATELLALVLYGPIIVLLHELGHAAFARAGGYRITSFGIGLGMPLFKISVSGGVVLHVDRLLLAGGSCNAIPVGPPTARRAWFHAGGLIAQTVLGVVLWALPDSWLINRIEQFNLLVALTNLIPWQLHGMASDGWYLLGTLLKGRRGGGTVIPDRATLSRIAAREQAVGSRVGVVYAELCLAWLDVLTGQTTAAGTFFAKDPPESSLDPWLDALYHYVLAEWHRLEGRPLAAVRSTKETRAALGSKLIEEAAAMICLAEARALVELDASAQAQRALARVAGIGGPVGRQGTAIVLAASIHAEDPNEIEFATWRVVRQVNEVWLDPADVAIILWEASQKLEDLHNLSAARGAREASRTLARRLLRSVTPRDQSSLVTRLGECAGERPLQAL